MKLSKVVYGLAYTAIVGYFAGKIYRKVTTPRFRMPARETGYHSKSLDVLVGQPNVGKSMEFFKRQMAETTGVPYGRLFGEEPRVDLAMPGNKDVHREVIFRSTPRGERSFLVEELARKNGNSLI